MLKEYELIEGFLHTPEAVEQLKDRLNALAGQGWRIGGTARSGNAVLFTMWRWVEGE